MDLVRLQPSTFVSQLTDLTPASLWPVVSDPLLLSELSSELQEVRIVRGGPVSLGTEFDGDQLRGERRWTTRSTVTQYEENSLFEWTVGDLHRPVSRWSFLIDSAQGVTTLTHKVVLCGGPSPLSTYIDENPHDAENVINQRLDDLRSRMATTIAGLLALAHQRLT